MTAIEVAIARQAVHEALIALPATEADRFRGLIADLERAVENRGRTDLDNMTEARRIAAEAADRFRDVVCEALGHIDDNPGDDALVSQLRAHFGHDGPEPTNWRHRLAGYEAIRDQINASYRDGSQP